MSSTEEDYSDHQGLLIVFTDPGESFPLDQYENWYDNEHIPNRLALPEPGIPLAARLRRADKERPTWATLYELSKLSVLDSDAYKKLFTNQSSSDKDALGRLEYLERRVYVQKPDGVYVKEGYTGLEKGVVTLLTSVDVEVGYDGPFVVWHEEQQIDRMKKVPGWLRTREYKVVEANLLRDTQPTGEYPRPPLYFALHEFSSLQSLSTEEFKEANSNPEKEAAFKHVLRSEVRVFEVYKVFERK